MRVYSGPPRVPLPRLGELWDLQVPCEEWDPRNTGVTSIINRFVAVWVTPRLCDGPLAAQLFVFRLLFVLSLSQSAHQLLCCHKLRSLLSLINLTYNKNFRKGKR